MGIIAFLVGLVFIGILVWCLVQVIKIYVRRWLLEAQHSPLAELINRYLGQSVQRWLLAGRQSPQLPSGVAEQLLRIERKIDDLEDEHQQLSAAVDWHGRLLRRLDSGL